MLVVGVAAVVAACGQAAASVEVGCVPAVLVEAVRCVQVASTGAVRSQETVSRMPGLSRESPIQSQTGPTSAGLAGLTPVYLAGLATGPTGVCLADRATGLAGAADGAETIGRDMVGVQPPWERAWPIRQQPTRITVTPITRPMATAIMDMVHMRPHTGTALLHMEPMPSRIALDASVRTIRQARRIFRTAASGFPAHNGLAKVVRHREWWSKALPLGRRSHYAALLARLRTLKSGKSGAFL